MGRILGLDPVPPPPHAFRLDEAGVAYAGFERRAEGLALVRTGEVELEPETFPTGLMGGPPREPAALRARVAELCRSLGDGVDEGSLVVPDAWLRVAFTDAADLPAARAERDDVLRFKLKRLVPFRVEELRLSSVEVEALPGQSDEEPHRLLLGFAVEQLLDQVEDAFSAAGVRLGRITSESLAALAAVSAAAGGGEELLALALVDRGGYTLVFARHGLPVLHRYKGFAGSLPEGSREGLVARDLRLTRTFLDENLPGVGLERVLVAAPGHDRDRWCDRLADSLDTRAEPLGRQHLPAVELTAASVEWGRLAPLVGLVTQEVA